MDDLLSEKEQIEQMRAWWSDYGYYVIGGVILGAAILFAINYYQSSVRDAQLQASALYDTLTDHIVDGRVDAAEAVAGQLSGDYADTAYAPQAHLAMARLYMDQNRDQDAVDTLREVLAGEASAAFKHVARLRLARILLYQDRADEVVAMLEGQTADAFAARYAETLGDAYNALGRHGEARDAYQQALSEPNQAATIDQSFVQLKLLDLPIDTFSAAAAPDAADAEATEADAAETQEPASDEAADRDEAAE